jgi:hypothetical protein
MPDPKNERMQNPGSPEPKRRPKGKRAGREPEKKHEKDKASTQEHPEWQDPEFDPSDISNQNEISR